MSNIKNDFENGYNLIELLNDSKVNDKEKIFNDMMKEYGIEEGSVSIGVFDKIWYCGNDRDRKGDDKNVWYCEIEGRNDGWYGYYVFKDRVNCIGIGRVGDEWIDEDISFFKNDSGEYDGYKLFKELCGGVDNGKGERNNLSEFLN